ncbi:hypothetical protein [Kineococcus sp. SYSU DK002]|uniref:hypothetical protein n=1 Tax=Kineococcus sp. SYSU DK002 TaxID=3383123 RepID=UPI003D7D2112
MVLAHRAGVPVGTGHALRPDGWAGPAVHLAGLAGPVPALVGWLLSRAFEAGAEIAHTHPGDDGEAAQLARPGSREVAAPDVFVDV